MCSFQLAKLVLFAFGVPSFNHTKLKHWKTLITAIDPAQSTAADWDFKLLKGQFKCMLSVPLPDCGPCGDEDYFTIPTLTGTAPMDDFVDRFHFKASDYPEQRYLDYVEQLCAKNNLGTKPLVRQFFELLQAHGRFSDEDTDYDDDDENDVVAATSSPARSDTAEKMQSQAQSLSTA